MKIDSFANRLEKALNSLNMKQSVLAEKTKIDKSLINKYIKGIAEPGDDNLPILAEILNVSEIWLMGYDVPKERIKEQKDSLDIDNIKFKEILIKKGLMNEKDEISEEDAEKLIRFAIANKDYLIKK